MRRKRRGEISPEDRALWAQVARTAKPLPGKTMPEVLALPEAVSTSSASHEPRPSAPQLPKIRSLPPLTGLDRRLRRDVSRGIREIGARIDLHGMRQAEAHRALLEFLHRAHHNGVRIALVITGKGGGLDARGREDGHERGVLRRMVPHWLADPLMRRIVLGYEAAAPAHGGEGALYVRLRRDRSVQDSSA